MRIQLPRIKWRQRVRRWFVIALVTLLTPVFLGTSPAGAVPGAPGFNSVILALISDNDFAAWMGDDKNVTRLFWQNDVSWYDQVAAMEDQDVVPRAGETFIYVLAMGGDGYTGEAGGPGTGGQEDWAGTINEKSLLTYPGAQVAIGKSTVDTRTITLDGYLLLNGFLPNFGASSGEISGGTYSPDLVSLQAGLTDAIWSPATIANHPAIASPRNDCTVSCYSANGPGFINQGWDYPDGSAVVFRFPLSAASLPVSAGNGQVVVDWEQPVGGEAVDDYLVYYKETSEPDASFKSFSVVNSATTLETVTGLTNGSSYTFRVTSRNANGVSAPTDSRSVTPTGPPSQPLNLSYAALGSSISVNFSPPENNGGFEISNYEYSINNGITWVARSPQSVTSPITISGLNDATTYQVKLRAVTPYGVGAASSAVSAIPIVNTTKTITFSKGTLDTVTSLAANQSRSAGYVLTIPAGPTRANFTFTGWKEGASSYQPNDTYTVGASNPTFTAQWIQDSLYGTGAGDRSKKLTWDISAGEEIDATVSADNGSSIRVVIPANALDAGTEVVFWRLLNQNIGLEKVSAANDYFLNIGVSWTIGDDLTSPKTVQVANSPIRMTIVNAVIERGAKAWQVVKGVSTLIGTATNAGQMDVAFRDDPLIVAANVDPEPVAQPQQQVVVPVGVPVIEPPVVTTPIAVKAFKSQIRVFFELGTAWLAPKEKNTLTKFVKDFASKNQIVDVAVAGYTQPTLINPNPQKLSVDRAKAVVKALKALGVNAKISATGKGNAKTNKASSRYALLTITGTALK